MNTSRLSSRGFTLIELLVVIAIIGILSSVVLAALNTARAKGRNAAAVSQIRQYMTAAEFYYDKYGKYPNSTANTTGTWNCLGTYADGGCWTSNTWSVDTGLSSAFKEFYSGLPGGGVVGGVEGYLYTCKKVTSGLCVSYEMRWYLDGSGVSCGPGKVGTLTQPAGYTYCQFLST